MFNLLDAEGRGAKRLKERAKRLKEKRRAKRLKEKKRLKRDSRAALKEIVRAKAQRRKEKLGAFALLREILYLPLRENLFLSSFFSFTLLDISSSYPSNTQSPSKIIS